MSQTPVPTQRFGLCVGVGSRSMTTTEHEGEVGARQGSLAAVPWACSCHLLPLNLWICFRRTKEQLVHEDVVVIHLLLIL